MSDPAPSDDLADLYENAPCGYLLLAPDDRILKINRTLLGWLGMPDGQAAGQTIHALLSFGGRIAFETHLAPLLRMQGSVDEIALDMIHAGGAKVPVIANATERRDEDDRHIVTRLTVFRAVDRRAYERRLIEARDRAEAVAKGGHEDALLREQFIAVLGHDLRNPLAAISAGLSLLVRRETLTGKGQRIAEEMSASVRRATALVENVLDFARGRLGQGLTLDLRTDLPLGPVIEQVVDEIRAASADRAIITRLQIDEPVDCDPARIAQLASNLLANAVIYGAPGSPIEVEAKTGSGKFVFSVANRGAPIPALARASLFQPFFRGVVRRSQQGLGLGLFIVSEIAKAHGGEMQVVSTDEETRFTFLMPLSQAR